MNSSAVSTEKPHSWILVALLSLTGFLLPIAKATGLLKATIFCLVIYVISTRRERVIALARDPIFLAFSIWTSYALISLGWSNNVDLSLKYFRNEFLFPLFLYMALFVIVSSHLRLTITIKIFLAGFALASGVQILVWLFSDVEWLTSLNQGPGDFSTCVGVVLPLVGTTLLDRTLSLRGRIVAGIVFAIVILGVWSTYNRMFWMALAVSLGVFGVLYIFTEIKMRKTRYLLLAGLAGLVAVMGLMFMAVPKLTNTGEMTLSGFADRISQDPRWQLWDVYTPELFESPAVGRGFIYDVQKLLNEEQKESLERRAWQKWDPLDAPPLSHAHNLYLNQLLRGGVIGSLFFFVLLATVGVVLFKGLKSPNPTSRLFAMAGVSALIFYLFKNLTDDFYTRRSVLYFWSVIVLFVAGTRYSESSNEQGRELKEAIYEAGDVR